MNRLYLSSVNKKIGIVLYILAWALMTKYPAFDNMNRSDFQIRPDSGLMPEVKVGI